MVWLSYLGVAVLFLIVGGFIGFFIARKIFTKQLRDNPPVTEPMIRAMYLSMGVKPSESKIKQTINAMNAAQKKEQSSKKK
jgi:uncharacterized protein YneF (UPF0154 family)